MYVRAINYRAKTRANTFDLLIYFLFLALMFRAIISSQLKF